VLADIVYKTSYFVSLVLGAFDFKSYSYFSKRPSLSDV